MVIRALGKVTSDILLAYCRPSSRKPRLFLFGAVAENTKRRLALYPLGESMIELIAGTTPDSRHARMVAEGRGGLNHICYCDFTERTPKASPKAR
jgi:hypothetical protein